MYNPQAVHGVPLAKHLVIDSITQMSPKAEYVQQRVRGAIIRRCCVSNLRVNSHLHEPSKYRNDTTIEFVNYQPIIR